MPATKSAGLFKAPLSGKNELRKPLRGVTKRDQGRALPKEIVCLSG
jgi:hypothetical protein